MADYIIPGAQAVTETLSRVGGVVAGCGEAALAVIQGVATGKPPSVAQVTSLIQQGAAGGFTGATGVATPSGLAQLAAASGTPVTIGSGQNVLSTVNSNLGQGLPTEIGVANAHVFGGSDANVAGHYITVVGKASNGNFIVADPNQPAALSGQFVQYSPSQITAANPFGTLTSTGAGAVGNAAGGVSGAVSSGVTDALNSLFGTVKSSLGLTSLPDLGWRLGLVVGGMVLIVVGMVMFFGHQESQAANIVVQQAGNAAKAAGAAAAG